MLMTGRPQTLTRIRREQAGTVLALSAVMIPVFLVMVALVIDAGNWYTHKRQLQNKVDAGALAGGVEYVSRLRNCVTSPGSNGIAISDVAKRYAGINDPSDSIVGPEYNQTINETSRLTVKINAMSEDPSDFDFSDGANPCERHNTGDNISPPGRWVDVKARESDIGTIAGGFGLNLDRVSAHARVEMKQIIGIQRLGLPFVAETGDVVECVWAEFIRARDGSTTGFSLVGGATNPVLLNRVGTSNTWERAIGGVAFTNAHDDVAVRYWLGSTDGATPCNFSDPKRVQLPEDDLSLPNNEGTNAFRDAVADGNEVRGLNWINVYDGGVPPGPATKPTLRLFRLDNGSCGSTAFITAPGPCTISFTAVVDDGQSPAPSQITVDASDPQIASVTVLTSAASTSGDLTTYTGIINLNPTAQFSPTSRSQSYTQTGQTYFSVSYRRTVGFVGGTNCATGGGCSGNLDGEPVNGYADIQQAIYIADPVTSTPLAYAELIQSGTTPITGSYSAGPGANSGSFTIRLSHNAVLNTAFISLMRESVQGTGNRTRAIYCGNPSSGKPAIEDAIINGCLKKLVVNRRSDSCVPPPDSAANPWDCVKIEQGNVSSLRDAYETRFTCTPNRWTSPSSLPPDGDPRWAYIVLTGFGRTIPAGNNDWLPIEGLIRIYVTGWDKKPGGGGGGGGNTAESCSGANDLPPRGYDGNGAQLWGHMVEIITTDGGVITGDEECNLNRDMVNCKPVLVR